MNRKVDTKRQQNFNPGLALIGVFKNRVMGKLIRRGLCRRPDFFSTSLMAAKKTPRFTVVCRMHNGFYKHGCTPLTYAGKYAR